jgi:hypothetical protein
MLQAINKGKIPSNTENSEDLLTSSVFGAIRYLSNFSLIQDIIANSINIHQIKAGYFEHITHIEYYFWPRLEKSEPDLLVLLKNKRDKYLVFCIEAKYFSGKSSEEDLSVEFEERGNHQRDQLARQIEDIHKDSAFKYLNIKKESVIFSCLIFLTNDNFIPEVSLKKGYQSIDNSIPLDFKIDSIYWLSWKEIYKQINKHVTSSLQDRLIKEDLLEFFRRKNLACFEGFSNLVNVKCLLWKFEQQVKKRGFTWNINEDINNLELKYGRESE